MNTVQSLKQVYQWLSDDISREIYRNRLEYLVTGRFLPVAETIRKFAPDVYKGTKEVYEFFENLNTDLPIVMYGTGLDAEYLLSIWDHHKLSAVCDSNPAKQGCSFFDMTILSPENLRERYPEAVVLVATSLFQKEVCNRIYELGYPKDRVIAGFYPAYHEDCNQYFEKSLIHYEKEEVFVDAGCFNLGTSLKLRDHANVKKVYAFEPDPECYKYCLKRKEETNYFQVEFFASGLWDEKTNLEIQMDPFGRSTISEKESGAGISAVRLDDVLDDKQDRVTFIKMDVEGAELKALKGAKETIQKDRPKLAISLYHKPEDMTEIPLYIRELVSDYKLYIRHYSNRQNETVLYAI